MNEALYRIRDRAALAQLASEGIHVLHQFDDELVLSRPLDRDIDGLVRVTDLDFVRPEQLRPEDLAGLAYRLRQTASFRASKTRRPTEGLSMDLIIRGKTGDIA
jgi:hypothetical protein